MVDRRRLRAFTLIELLVTVAIIAMLVTILLPSLRQAKEQAKNVVCQTRIKGWYGAMRLYAEDWDGFIPKTTESRDLDPSPSTSAVQTDWMHILTPWPRPVLQAAMAMDNSWNYVDATYGPFRPPVVYADSTEIYFCPSQREGEWLNRNYWVPDAVHMAYGSYGLTMSSCGWDNNCLWSIIMPDKMYLGTDCYTTSFDRYDENDIQYDTRHGSKADTVNMLFMDGHIEPTYEDDIAPLRYLTVWRGSLPWYNAGSVRYN